MEQQAVVAPIEAEEPARELTISELTLMAAGRVQGLELVQQFSTTAQARLLHEIRTEKLWKEAGFGGWGEFCATIGIAKRTADRIVNQYEELGGQLFAAVAEIGLSVRGRERLRRLPPGIRPYLAGKGELVIPWPNGEERIGLGGNGAGAERVQAAIEKLLLLNANSSQERESAERRLGKIEGAYERQLQEMRRDLDAAHAKIAERRIPEKAKEILAAIKEGLNGALDRLRLLDFDSLTVDAEAISDIAGFAKMLQGIGNRMELELNRACEAAYTAMENSGVFDEEQE